MAKNTVKMATDTKPGFFYGYYIMIACFFIIIAMGGIYYAFGVFIKPMIAEFGWSRAETSGPFSLSLIMQGVGGIIVGKLNDKLGPRITMTMCGTLMGIGYLLTSLTTNIWHLYLYFGLIAGIGLSGAIVPLLSTMARWFIKRRSLMTGVVLTGTGVGSLFTPFLANWIINQYDWRLSYIVMGSAVLIIVVSASQFLKRDPSVKGLKPYGEQLNHGVSSDTEGLSLREVMHTRQFWLIFGMHFSFGVCMFTALVHIVPHAIEIGFSPTIAASILSAVGGAVVIGRLVMGVVADRITDRWAFILEYILIAIFYVWVAVGKDLWMLYVFALGYGFSFAGMGTSESPIIAHYFGLKSHGVVFGVSKLNFFFGAAIGPTLAGYIFDVTGSYQLAFLIAAATGVAGIVFLGLLTPIKKQKIALDEYK